MKIASLFFLTLFFITNSFADDGVKDPVGIMGCKAKENIEAFKNPGDKKILKKVNCKDMVRWYSTVDFDPNSETFLKLFAFDSKKIKDLWWTKLKLSKNNEFVWVNRPTNFSASGLIDNRYIERETEMSEKWDGKIYPNPDFKNPKVIQKYGKNAIYKELKTVNGRLWVRVELIEEECFPPEEPPVLARGWIPFMHSNTESNFYEEQDCTP